MTLVMLIDVVMTPVYTCIWATIECDGVILKNNQYSQRKKIGAFSDAGY